MQNVIEARIQMVEDGLLKTREQAEELAKVMLDVHVAQLMQSDNLKGLKVREHREGPVEVDGVFVFKCLLEWEPNDYQ